MHRDFKGVWIPKEIYLNTELSWTEKIFLIEVHSLEGEDGCFASNSHFAEFLDLSEGAVANLITKLKTGGWLAVEGYGKTRRIYAKVSSVDETSGSKFHKNVKVVSQNYETPIYRINNTKSNTAVVAAVSSSDESAFDVYRRYCHKMPLNIFNEERLRSVTEDLDVFTEVMEIWVGRQYQEQNITGILNLFSRLLADKKKETAVVEAIQCDKCVDGWIEVDGGFTRCSH